MRYIEANIVSFPIHTLQVELIIYWPTSLKVFILYPQTNKQTNKQTNNQRKKEIVISTDRAITLPLVRACAQGKKGMVLDLVIQYSSTK